MSNHQDDTDAARHESPAPCVADCWVCADEYAARREDFHCGSDYPGRTGP